MVAWIRRTVQAGREARGRRLLRNVVMRLIIRGSVLVVVAGIALALSALRLPSKQIAVDPAPLRAVDAHRVATHLAEALRFRTIAASDDPADTRTAAFEALHAWLAETYPLLHRTLARERVGAASLLYTWQGTDPALEPIVLLAHQDVVPAENAERWTRPPFDGRVEDGFVWGRGAIDDKGSLVAICEAVEALLREGFTPRRSVLLAFGHDEEVGGRHGAQAIARVLEHRGVRALLAIDEGAAIVHDLLPGLSREVALVGIAEKGSLTLEVVARAEGGHSSTPPRETAAGVLARAISRIEANPLPGGVVGVTRSFFESLGPELPLWARTAVANLWLFGAPMDWALSRSPGPNALLRTTTAVTMLQGSPKENVLPVEAIATVNFRLLPGDTSEQVRGRVEAIVADERIEVRARGESREASAVSPVDGPAFALVQRTIGEIFGSAIVAPFLTVGGTDARHYAPVTDALYRFAPFVYGPADLKLPHGIDERLSVENLGAGVRFYARLVENASAR
jgi:carboxypeptidase PM20D1